MYLDRSRWLFPNIRGMGTEKLNLKLIDGLKVFFLLGGGEVGGSPMRIPNFQERVWPMVKREKEGGHMDDQTHIAR